MRSLCAYPGISANITHATFNMLHPLLERTDLSDEIRISVLDIMGRAIRIQGLHQRSHNTFPTKSAIETDRETFHRWYAVKFAIPIHISLCPN